MLQKYRPVRIGLFLALIGTALASCTDAAEDLAAPLDSSLSASRLQASQIRPISEEDAELRELARRLAIALGSDPALRKTLAVSLRTSPYREEKRHVRTLITQLEPQMLTGIARAGNASAGSVMASLDKVTDLETYLPVEAHRSHWKGGSNLIVAGAIADDPSVPIHAFDLQGRPVALSWNAPPETPVLAIVPNETDFSDPWESGSVERSAAATQVVSMSMPSASVVLTRLRIKGDWEGWLMGSAEMEMHTTDQSGKYVKCAGAQKASPLYFDTQGGEWTGEVLLETNYSTGTRYFEMWEDDRDPCKGSSDGVTPKTSAAIKGIVEGTKTSAVKLVKAVKDSSWLKKLEAVVHFVSLVDVVTSGHKDDLVGRIMIPRNCWPRPNTKTFKVRRGNTVNGTANVEFRMAGKKTPICPPNPHITGPSLVDLGSRYTWKSNVTTGVSPYSYRWYRNGIMVGTGANYTWTVVGGNDFSVRVKVTDSHSPQRTVTTQEFDVFVQQEPPGGCEPHDDECET